jgi:hypothetical protein
LEEIRLSEQQLVETVISAARKVLLEGMKKIEHCGEQLTDARLRVLDPCK